jgi:hypothetical protein
MATFVRFETPYRCETSYQPMGVFWALATVEDRADLAAWTRDWLSERWKWFARHLPAPRREAIDPRATFWFDSRSQIVGEIWSLVAFLREEGVYVGLRRTRTPGRIIYRDDFQIAAIPPGRKRRRRKQKLPRLN